MTGGNVTGDRSTQEASALAREAADLLWDRWAEGTVVDALPERLCPQSRQEGYAIQAVLESKSAHSLFGWKIAATSQAGQAHIAVDGPLAGRLLRERVFDSGGTVPFGANRMRVAEAEFAFRMARDLGPRDVAYTVAEVLDAIASLHPAIEIPDSRFSDFTKVGAAQLIADNACALYFVLGPPATADWRGRDLADHRVRGEIVGGVQREGVGRNVLGGPLLALTWMANELRALGVTLKAGEVVTTGTCLIPLEIQPGDRVAMDFGDLGRVEATLGGR